MEASDLIVRSSVDLSIDDHDEVGIRDATVVQGPRVYRLAVQQWPFQTIHVFDYVRESSWYVTPCDI